MNTCRALPHLSAGRSGAHHLTSQDLSSLMGVMIPYPSESPGLHQMGLRCFSSPETKVTDLTEPPLPPVSARLCDLPPASESLEVPSWSKLAQWLLQRPPRKLSMRRMRRKAFLPGRCGNKLGDLGKWTETEGREVSTGNGGEGRPRRGKGESKGTA